MALGRLSVKVGKKGKASKHAQYIFREGKYAKDENLEDLEFVGHGNMPTWAEHNPNFFWQMADEHERKNGSTYREHEIALPRELTPQQRIDLVQDWIKQELGDKHAYQFAIHNPVALDGGEQPHVHLMFSDRLIDDIERDPDQYFKRYNSKHPERGGAKKANTAKLSSQRKQELKEMRGRWESLHNSHMKKAGINKIIIMKSYADLGVKYKPLDIPMHKFKQPHIKQAYIEQLQHKKDFFELKRERSQINVTQELKRLRTEKNEQPKPEFNSLFDIAEAFKPKPKPKPKPEPEPEPEKLTDKEHTLSYKAMLYINSSNNELEPGKHFFEYDTVEYDERQVREIVAFRQKYDLDFKGTEFENFHTEYVQRVKDFFHDDKNIADSESKRMIKMITEPEREREEYRQKREVQQEVNLDLNSNSDKNDLQKAVKASNNKGFRP